MYNLKIQSKHTLYSNYVKRFVVCTNNQMLNERLDESYRCRNAARSRHAICKWRHRHANHMTPVTSQWGYFGQNNKIGEIRAIAHEMYSKHKYGIRSLDQWESYVNQYGGFMLDVYWFSGLMLCICNLCHFVCDSPKEGHNSCITHKHKT